jgi:hypothetical protein
MELKSLEIKNINQISLKDINSKYETLILNSYSMNL